jgi:signal transduction histidine kinase
VTSVRVIGRRPRSLLWSIAAGLVVVSAVAVLVAGLLLYYEFNGINDHMRERTLQGEARMIAGALSEVEGRVVLPDGIVASLRRNGERFAVVDDNGTVLHGSDGVSAPLYRINRRRDRDFFALQNGDATFYGVTRRVLLGPRSLWIQVASSNRETSFDSMIEEFINHVAWIWLPFVVVLLLVNLLIIHRGLKPLRIASATAAAIGPETASMRLPEARMPREVLPLVAAVNKAFDRLEAGYKAQRNFIADAAHELRTPLAVLKAHLAILEDRPAVASLQLDVEAMERLVGQLLDLARLDVMQLKSGDIADLARLAVEVATHLAPLAVARGRSIEVVGCERPMPVHGAADFLFRALRNLVENALNHTSPETTVTIAVAEPPSISVIDHGPGIAPERRKQIFERFWRGDQAGDQGGGHGVGLGLAIVARTVAAHGATIDIADAPGGGAQITIHFPKAHFPPAAVAG